MIFDSEQILELFKSDEPYFRKIAFKAIVDDFEIHGDLFFDLFSTGAVYKDAIHCAYRRFPSLCGGFDRADAFISSKKYVYFSRYADEHALFLEKLQEYLRRETCPEKQGKLIANLSGYFEGLKSDLSHLFPHYRDTGDRSTDCNRQLMIFITGKCNLNCPYCFSGELEHLEMSLTDLEEILHWASRNQVAQIPLCGGEPTLHSRFDEILRLIEKQGFKTYFASNFTVDCSALKNFNARVIEKIYIHISDQTLDNPCLSNQVLKNIEHAKKKKIELTCRTNISDKKPSTAKWFQFLQKTAIRTLNVALTFPSSKASNKYVDIHSFEEYRFVLEEIIQESKELGLDLSFAKPIPLCIFEEQTNHHLLKLKKFFPLCNINEQNGMRNICINFQKEFHACPGVTVPSLKFRKNMEWQEVENFCIGMIPALLTKPLWTKCIDCFLFDRKLCQGACLSYKSRS